MMFRMVSGLVLVLGLAVAGCGQKGEENAAPDSARAAGEVSRTETASPTPADPVLEESPGEASPEEAIPKSAPDDPSAFYRVSDIPEEGGYIKLDLVELESRVLNRVLHRIRTEPATCDGCDGYTLHDILLNSPDCMPCLMRAREIIAEERTRS